MTDETETDATETGIATAGEGAQGAIEAQPEPFLEAVGARVRGLRTAHRLSRRALAERAGLSQRFIAQLEGGYGNISVRRLKTLVDALDGDLAEVVAGISASASANADAACLAHRIARAPEPVKSRIFELLDTGSADVGDKATARRIALVGLRGAGKSTLGQLSAARLGLDFVELNAEISRASGLGVDEIFALYGGDGYRRLEREQLRRIAARTGLVLAVAGGIVDHHETYRFLKENFMTVWLKARPQEHMSRVIAQGDNRPMAGAADAMADLNRILEGREAFYAEADATLDTSDRTLEMSAEELATLVDALLNQ